MCLTVAGMHACRFAWPQSPMLQLRVVLCVLLLVLMRGLNLAVPITYKKLVDQLAAATSASPEDRPSFKSLLEPWELLYLAAIFFQGGAGGGITGFVNNARQWLWIPVSQDAYRWDQKHGCSSVPVWHVCNAVDSDGLDMLTALASCSISLGMSSAAEWVCAALSTIRRYPGSIPSCRMVLVTCMGLDVAGV